MRDSAVARLNRAAKEVHESNSQRADMNDKSDTSRRLIWHGVFLFLLGLLTGFIVMFLKNPRMGLSAHLEGVMNGTFLIAIGAVWPKVFLAPRAASFAFWLALFGTYTNWATVLLGAAWGTSQLSPIAGAGYSAMAWQEMTVNILLYSLSAAIVACCVIILWGLRRKAIDRVLTQPGVGDKSRA
ncbi:MAG: hydrogenase [Acidobacteriota bacterium]